MTFRNHPLQEAIKETVWKKIAEFGAPAHSLRTIARELKISDPAIYIYVPDRAALVTALIIDAFTLFGDSQLEARDLLPANAHFRIPVFSRNSGWASACPAFLHSAAPL